jgi:hypothetical protein
MSLIRRRFLLTAIVLLLGASQAFAGGFKRNGSIKVTNSSSQTVLVYYDDSSAAITTALNDTDALTFAFDFQAAGGVAVSPGGTHKFFGVKAGDYTFLAIDEAQADAALLNGSIGSSTVQATLPIVVNAGQCTSVTVSNSTTNAPTSPVTTTAPDISLTSP